MRPNAQTRSRASWSATFTSLAGLLQGHAGQRFTFALVELAIYSTGKPAGRLVVGSVLAQTVLLERGVVRISASLRQGQQIIVEPPENLTSKQSATRGMSFAEDEFYEMLEETAPGLADELKAFADKAAVLGVYAEVLGCDRTEGRSGLGGPGRGQ